MQCAVTANAEDFLELGLLYMRILMIFYMIFIISSSVAGVNVSNATTDGLAETEAVDM